MFGKYVSSVEREETAALSYKNRQSPRRSDDSCVGIINGQMHPIDNWSSGGMYITADERLFSINQECVFTLKFKLRDKIMEVDHKAKVIRKMPGKVALQFLDLTRDIQSSFQKVVDDYVSRRFAESQL